MAIACRYCITKKGLKGSEIKNLPQTDEEFANHVEETHGILVMREGETEEQTKQRCAKKGIVSDRMKCQCGDCREMRM